MEEFQEKEPENHSDTVIELEEALRYVSRYFIYHADQRLKTFRYFLIYLAAVTTGFYSLYNHCHYFILIVGGFCSLIITLVFLQLEKRNKQLIKIGSEGCQLIEDELVKWLPTPNGTNKSSIEDKAIYYQKLKIVSRGEKERDDGFSYRTAIKILFWIAIFLHFLVIGFALDAINFFKPFQNECIQPNPSNPN